MTLNRLYLFSGMSFFLAKLWLVQAHSLIGIYSPHDNLLFIRLAHHLLSGEWLGAYNQLTLIKGPFYPIFIAFCWWICIPLLAAQQIFFGIACLTVIGAINPLVKQKWLLLIFFLFLLFNPFSYNYPMVGRVYRLGIYPSLSLMIFAALFGLYIRLNLSMKNSLWWAVGLGVVFAAFWHTREEGVWIIPSLMLIASILVIQTVRNQYLNRFRTIIIISTPFLIWLGCTLTLNTINWFHYGVFNTIEIKTKAFKSAYSGIMRITPIKFRRHYPTPLDVRLKAYQASPALKKIQILFEKNIAPKWQALLGTDDIPAGWFIWAFRDAVAKTGNFQNGSEALAFYDLIGSEIETACNTGELDCSQTTISLMPPWRKEYTRILWPSFFRILKHIIHFDDFCADATGIRSSGPINQLILYDIVTREKILSSRRDVIETYPDYHINLNRKKIHMLNIIGRFYQKSISILFIGAFIFTIIIAITSVFKQHFNLFTIFSMSVLIGIISNTAILSIVNITTGTPIIRPMHTCYPLVLLFIITAAVDCFSRIRNI